jgi:hypothetical protein
MKEASVEELSKILPLKVAEEFNKYLNNIWQYNQLYIL